MPHRRMYSSRLLRCPEWGKNFITVALTTTHVLYMNLIIQNACLKILIKTHLEIFWANQSIHCRPSNLHTFESTARALKLCLQASFVVVHLLSRVRLCDPMDSSIPGFPILLCLPEFRLCCPTMSSSTTLLLLPSVFPASGSSHVRWPKFWSFSFSVNPSNEYSGLISFRIDWFNLLAVQGTLKSLLQHHSSKSSILQYSVFWNKSHICIWLLEKS